VRGGSSQAVRPSTDRLDVVRGPSPTVRRTPPAPGRWPSVTVVIPVHGDQGLLARTIASLAAQDYPGEFDVVVVDNGDNRGLDVAVEPLARAVVVREAERGSYAARNAALEHARGEVLAFTDADCLPRGNWLTMGVSELLATGQPAFVGGAIELFAADPRHPTFAELWDRVNGLRQGHYVQEQGWAATANMLTLRTTFDAVGAFAGALKSGGDREWGERAAASGVRPVFSAAAVVDHPARSTMAELHSKVRRVTRGDVDSRRTRGLPMFDPGTLLGVLRPNTRSIVTFSRRVSSVWTLDRIRYVLVAHWLQYYFFAAKVRHVAATGRNDSGGLE